MKSDFPVFPVGTVFKKFDGLLDKNLLAPRINSVVIDFPVRLNAMSIDASAVTKKGSTSFPAGEVMISIQKYVIVTTEYIGEDGSLTISNDTRRKVLVKHAYQLMCMVLGKEPSLHINVDDSTVMKHTGFGSSGAIIAAVCASINELYGNPIRDHDLISYIANNYGEEVTDEDEDKLKLVQCIGGSVASGFTQGGISIITGNATPIMSISYESNVVIGVPNDYEPKTANELMELEESFLDNFQSHGEKYSHEIAYNLLHKGMPQLRKGDISELNKIIFAHRFKMGSIYNCSFVYPRVNSIAAGIQHLYENNRCQMLAMSSVGPAFFALVNNERDELFCIDVFRRQQLNTSTTSICNNTYTVKKNNLRK